MASARRYGARLADGFRAVRRALDAFNPDFVLIWGDDQYENFREDIIPAFCVMGLDQDFAIQPWYNGNGGKPNRWGETGDWQMKLHGQRAAANFLARALIDRGIDMAYAYKPLHIDGLAHAFTNTLLYLDWDRRGFPWPVVPFAINCYGSNLIHAKGGMAALFQPPRPDTMPEDPPAPQPWRCMEVGKAVAEILAESPYRVAVVASSSWSHCFLSPTNGYLWPDHAADRAMFDALGRTRLRLLARTFARADGAGGAARDAELDGADGGDGDAGQAAGDLRLRGDARLHVREVLRGVSLRRLTKRPQQASKKQRFTTKAQRHEVFLRAFVASCAIPCSLAHQDDLAVVTAIRPGAVAGRSPSPRCPRQPIRCRLRKIEARREAGVARHPRDIHRAAIEAGVALDIRGLARNGAVPAETSARAEPRPRTRFRPNSLRPLPTL